MDAIKIKKGLGRGLSSLIGDTKVEKNINKLLISELTRNRYQPRKVFDKENLDELTNSIRERGIIQPIIVRKSQDNNSKYEIIAGERRWLAAQNAGFHEVPVVITEADDLKSLEFAIVENVQRKDLNPIEEAEGYKRLIEDFKYDQDKVAKFIGKSRTYIANCLRLLTLPDKVIEYLIEEKITQGHAKVLVGLDNVQLLAEKIISKKLSVRQSEALARLTKNKPLIKKSSKDINISDIENKLTEKIGMRVNLNNKKNNSGTLTFYYKGLDQMDRLIEIIKKNY